MGLTLAEVELARLDSEQPLVERERACAENILSKIDDVLWVSLSVNLSAFEPWDVFDILSMFKLCVKIATISMRFLFGH